MPGDVASAGGLGLRVERSRPRHRLRRRYHRPMARRGSALEGPGRLGVRANRLHPSRALPRRDRRRPRWAGWLGVAAVRRWSPSARWLLFPVVLLSMLENDSPMNPVSPPVWRTCSRHRRAWGRFSWRPVLLAAAVVLALPRWWAVAGLLWNATATGLLARRGVDDLLPLAGQARLVLRRPLRPRRAGGSDARSRRRPGRRPCRRTGRRRGRERGASGGSRYDFGLQVLCQLMARP